MVELPDDPERGLRTLLRQLNAPTLGNELLDKILARVRAEAVADAQVDQHVIIPDMRRQIELLEQSIETRVAETVADERQRAGGLVQQFFKEDRRVDWGDIIELSKRILGAGSVPVATSARPQRYEQCDGTCTVDCGHCKGQGPPVATPTEPERPEIVVLCGSTRFKDAFCDEARRLAREGRMVLTVADLDMRPEARHVNVPIDDETKARLDWLHKRKIDLADRAHFLNVGGYIGESTRSELEYARSLGKRISFLEPDAASPVPAGQPGNETACFPALQSHTEPSGACHIGSPHG